MDRSYTSRSPVLGLGIARALVECLGARPAAAIADTSTIHLSQNPEFNPQPGDDPADYAATEADFSGYNGSGYAVTWSVPLQNGTGMISLAGSAMIVVGSADPQIGNNIYGYWVENADGLIFAERFAGGESLPMANPGDYLDLLALYPIDLTPVVSA